MKGFNPLIPCDIDSSSIPLAVIDFELTNDSLTGGIIHHLRHHAEFYWRRWLWWERPLPTKTRFIEENNLSGIHFTSEGVDKASEQWGEMALACISQGEYSYRTAWYLRDEGTSILDFWDDLTDDGLLDNRTDQLSSKPMASLALSNNLLTRRIKICQIPSCMVLSEQEGMVGRGTQ
ncbi:MAG: GH116 family glycosyl-hydrolase [Marinilabiliales bacterium]|nr:GH116 family glycosyl-hydrolase [Marinilabiliales bacterium]